MLQSVQITPELYLVRHPVSQKENKPPKKVDIPTNHFAIIDCSGSMYYDLPQIREQLKKKLPKLLREKDTISIIWFSGRGEYGTLLKGEPVASLTDLQEVERAIDRWLKPVGLTGFKEPLQEASQVVEDVLKGNPGSVASLFFMSDGCDNQWNRSEILKATESAAGKFASATFVEYGYYADRPLLTAMAEKAGGQLIFAESFNQYAPTFEAAVQKKQSGAPRVEIDISADVIEGFAFSLTEEGDLLTYSVEGGKAQVPEDLSDLYYLAPQSVGVLLAGQLETEVVQRGLYSAVSAYAIRMKPKVVLPLLKLLGDVRFIDRFASCFGKQAYSAFQADALAAAVDKNERLLAGYDPTKVPAEDAFTVLDLLDLLSSDENNRLLLDRDTFKYNRIGRGRVDASDQLTEAEQEEIKELTSKLATLKKASEIKKVNARIAEITESKPEALKFVSDPAPDGYPISNLTFNESRPNVSVLVRKTGKVDLSERIPEEFVSTLPEAFETFIYRNYAIIKDGLINVEELPVSVTPETYDKLMAECPNVVVSTLSPLLGTTEVLLNLRGLPVINQKMINDLSAQSFFETHYALLKIQAEQKVYNSYMKELFPGAKSEGFAVQYGKEATEWLKEQGFTDYSGFSPKSVQAEASDVYMGKELKTALKGYSKLPSLNELRKQKAKGKYNPPGALMAPTMEEVEEVISQTENKPETLKAWLDGQAQLARAKTRDLLLKLAKDSFALIVGQTWFSEFSSLDENSLDLAVDGKTIACKVEMREIEVKI